MKCIANLLCSSTATIVIIMTGWHIIIVSELVVR